MIAFIGDVHERLAEFRAVVDRLPQGVIHVVQVGDMWVLPDDHPMLRRHPDMRWRRLSRDVHFIDGNHHYYPETRGLTKPTFLRPGLTYLPRGTVLEWPDRHGRLLRVGFLGGGDSIIDRWARREGEDWWPDESVATVEGLDLYSRPSGSIDLLVTHTPPESVVREIIGRAKYDAQQVTLEARGISAPTARTVELVWDYHGRPPLICGHMHQEWRGENVTVLPFLGVEFV